MFGDEKKKRLYNIVTRSLDSMLSELPVDNLVMVTDPVAKFGPDWPPADADEFMFGKSLLRTGEMVTLLSFLAENNFMAPSTPALKNVLIWRKLLENFFASSLLRQTKLQFSV